MRLCSLSVIFSCFLVFGLLSCSQKTAFVSKAPPEASQTYTSVPEISELNIPIRLSTTGLENTLNTRLNGLLYEETNLPVSDILHIDVKVWKQDRILLRPIGEEIHYVVPLKIWVNAHLQTNLLGIDIHENKETECAIELSFKTKIGIDSTWKVLTNTTLENYRWLTAPTLKVGSIEVPLSFLGDFLLKNQQEMLTGQLDEQIRKSLPLKSILTTVWSQLQEPMRVSDNPTVWLLIQPIAPYMTPLDGKKDFIHSSIGITAYLQTYIGIAPPPSKSALPFLKTAKIPQNQCHLALTTYISYETATEMTKQALVGQKFQFDEGKKEVTIRDISLYPNNDKIVIKTTLEGSLNGTVYLKGLPVYDSVSKEVKLMKTAFDLDTRNKLHKTANWLLHGVLEKKLEPYLKYSLASQLTETEELVRKSLHKQQISPGIWLDGHLTQLQPKHIVLSPQGIKTIVRASGDVMLHVEGF